MSSAWRQVARDWLGPKWTVRARCMLRRKPLPLWGNLRRTRPFSTDFGFDRGMPIDRYYLEKFLTAHAAHIRGRVLEIQMAAYGRRFGQDVTACHSIDINPDVRPTYVCDLAHSEDDIPSDSYDCFLMPSTLQHLRELEPALANARRIVRPGGAVIATAAGFVPLVPDHGSDLWHLTAAGWREMAQRVWPHDDVEVTAYGNCLAAIAALHGIAVEELDRHELDVVDPRYPVLIGIACVKRARDDGRASSL
jgi:SAM-dependent methyltransferase